MQGQALTVMLGSSLSKSQQLQSMHSFRGWGWCRWNRRGKATRTEEADPCSGATQFPFLYVGKTRIPLSLSALDNVELSIAAGQALAFCF